MSIYIIMLCSSYNKKTRKCNSPINRKPEPIGFEHIYKPTNPNFDIISANYGDMKTYANVTKQTGKRKDKPPSFSRNTGTKIKTAQEKLDEYFEKRKLNHYGKLFKTSRKTVGPALKRRKSSKGGSRKTKRRYRKHK